MFYSYDDHFERDAYEQVQKADLKDKLSHELVAAAAAYAAMQAYQTHEEKNGKPANLEEGKDLIAGLAAAEVDRLVNTKDLNHIDRAKVKHDAQEHAKLALSNSHAFGLQDYDEEPYVSFDHHAQDMRYGLRQGARPPQYDFDGPQGGQRYHM